MSQTLALPPGWKSVTTPPSLFARYEFASYTETREFLDRLAVLSEETRLYPDLGFGRTHVNVTIRGSSGGMPAGAELEYACRAAALSVAAMP
jgi:pterin-4a-carbinolamine dehydratase